MIKITEGDLTFSFPTGCQVSKYDEWSFYRKQFQPIAGGSKAIDILCVEGDTSWLIEIKDYRQYPRTKAINIDDELAIKVRDTLAGLAAAAKAANEADQRELAQKALASSQWRVVLHLEQPATKQRLWPKVPDPANLLLQPITKKLKAINARPVVCHLSNIPHYIPWTVRYE
ncbi:MAG: hypothetical protein TE42_04390 [Candidatus Synechococcus spongiarum SP3]|uniref:Cysteinyl-tRNA synthetase n=1 Tax=Candidatus Synechococcus spongiarum SP3 TaxID=1604020 RepID=A0A0G2HLB5_9SYNE|nr:MAG: hypothetical protein TE42_04390 [Candidatus Synechococcus spongiarum SP3]